MMSQKKGSPAVSVIMLTYNREQCVGRAIESIQRQMFDSFEFIIVDNGSVDNSGAICDEYAKKDSRISVIHRKKGNIGSGRNTGLLAAHGEYITFVDDDDTAEPDMIAFLYDLITKHQADISICGSWRSTGGVLTPKYIYDKMLTLNTEQAVMELLRREYYNVGFPTKMFKQSLIVQGLFPERGQYDDITTAYKIFAKAQKVVAYGVAKYTACRHEGNNSAFSVEHQLLRPDILEEYLSAYRERTEYLLKKLPSIKDYVEYSEWSFMISMCEKITRYKVECEKQFEIMRIKLIKNKETIVASPFLKDFERAWFEEIVDTDARIQ